MQGTSGNTESLPQAGPAETQANAGENAAREQGLRIAHSRPTVFEGAEVEPGNRMRYNNEAALPAKYATPSEFKDKLDVKNKLIGAYQSDARDPADGGAGGPGVTNNHV